MNLNDGIRDKMNLNDVIDDQSRSSLPSGFVAAYDQSRGTLLAEQRGGIS
jgi:hypothetical protein